MDDTTLKIAIAGLLHDIGKLAEEGMYADEGFINGNAGLYQPYFGGQHTHRHAVYTAAFIDHIEKLLPRIFNRAGWGLDDTFINLAAGHHKPETPMQWLVAVADRISSGWDRANFDSEYNAAIAWQDCRRTRLLPVFERLLRDGINERGRFSYRYPLQVLSPRAIFPMPHKDAEPDSDEKAKSEYKGLFDEFVFALEKLKHKDENIELWFDHLDSLLLIHTSMVPAARAGKVVPDVSLYDHSRGVSALASALYLYHRDRKSMADEAIRDYDPRKFLLIGGDFYGIQDFIFNDSGDAGKGRAKILRGRSFAISLYCELAADMICRVIGLPSTSLVLNAAGKFTIIAPNTESAVNAVKEAELKINRWLIGVTFGESAMGISTLPASPADFVAGKFLSLWERLTERMAERKFRKLDLDTFGGAVKGYLDSFQNDLRPPLCPYCGKRPSSPEVSRDRDEERAICRICRDHIFLGENLVKGSRIAVTQKDADIRGERKLAVPIFDEYQVAFTGGALGELAAKGDLYKYWDISVDASGHLSGEVTARFLAGYVPVFSEKDQYDDRFIAGRKSDEKKERLIEEIREGRLKTFEHLAAKAMNIRVEAGKTEHRGIQALGILKADVDQLGLLMACGLEEKDFTLSRLATLSRQLHFFFAVYLTHLLKTDPRFGDVYTVFAGGDDLFLIGPWNRVIDLAEWLRDRFEEYTCGNEHIHFSAGIALEKPHVPLGGMATDADEALRRSKEAGRGRVTVFGETATWEEFAELRKIRDRLEDWRERRLINSAAVFRLNALIDQAKLEREVRMEADVPLEDMECLKWRAYFRYSTERNIGRDLKDEKEKRKAKDEFCIAAEWLDRVGGRLRIPLWDLIYNNR